MICITKLFKGLYGIYFAHVINDSSTSNTTSTTNYRVWRYRLVYTSNIGLHAFSKKKFPLYQIQIFGLLVTLVIMLNKRYYIFL